MHLNMATKTCSKCREQKFTSAFHKNKSQIDGYANQCKYCFSLTESISYRKTKRRHKDTLLRRKFGITHDDYDSMLLEQNSGCAICGRVPRNGENSLVVDHDHETGVVRGLLCGKCNTSLGTFGDNIAGLERVLAYLKQSCQ